MSEEKKIVELTEKDLKQVTGGQTVEMQIKCLEKQIEAYERELKKQTSIIGKMDIRKRLRECEQQLEELMSN